MKTIRVFLLKDVEKIGMAGEIIKAAEGYARNFLIPRKIGIEVTKKNESSFVHRIKVVEKRKEAINSKTSLLAERIKAATVTFKRKIHDNDQLYGSISAKEIADELSKQHGVSVSNSQVLIAKSIKTKGQHSVTIKLSNKLQPQLRLKVVTE